jgi:hypothetical protein
MSAFFTSSNRGSEENFGESQSDVVKRVWEKPKG